MTNETCTICGYWRGLHQSDTMRCPANGREDGRFVETTYTEESEELAALRAENAKLREVLKPCIALLDGLVEESKRSIDWGEEDSFRMGEWFEREDIDAIEAARRALESHV